MSINIFLPTQDEPKLQVRCRSEGVAEFSPAAAAAAVPAHGLYLETQKLKPDPDTT